MDPAPLKLTERLEIYYERLEAAPAASNADEALDLVCTILHQVEDEFSGVPARDKPGLKYEGRMYPPRQDYVVRATDGSLFARTKGHDILCSAQGDITIISRRSKEQDFQKQGRDG